MKRGKFITVLVICFVIIVYGVFTVNVGFTKLNNKTISKSIFATMEGDKNNIGLSYNALYAELNLFNNEENKLEVYFNLKPFDIRLGLGNKILYINSSIINNIKIK